MLSLTGRRLPAEAATIGRPLRPQSAWPL